LNTKCFDILQKCFQANKPIYLVTNHKKLRDEDDKDPNDQMQKKSKPQDQKDKNKDKYPYRDVGAMVKNPNSVQDWILPGTKYKSILKEVIGNTPAFNDSGLVTCNKWHIRGFCYKKCDRKNSHKKFDSASHRAMISGKGVEIQEPLTIRAN
jgi:hypothetical protein